MRNSTGLAAGFGVRITRRGPGFAAWGERFYLWDEDVGTLLHDAVALARAGGRRRELVRRSATVRPGPLR